MRRRHISTAIVALAVFLGTLPAIADTPEEAVYLSLGTSLAAGSLADESGATTLSSDWGYPDQLYQRLTGRLAPNLVHEKLGCPGETTATIRGGLNAFGQPSSCIYDAGSQLAQAQAEIAQGDVVLITIDLGANDVVHAQLTCQGDPGCIGAALPSIAGEVGEVMAALRGAGYAGPIVAMNYYNPQVASGIGFYHSVAGRQAPNEALARGSDQLTRAFNALLAYHYGTQGVAVVDVYTTFNSADFDDDQPANGTWDNIDVICAWSYMCPADPTVKANFHLNPKGYRMVAKAFLADLVDGGIVG